MLQYSLATIFFPEFNFQSIRNIYLVLIALIFITFFKLKINILLALMLVAIILSICFNSIEPIFKPEIRFVFLILVFLVFGLILKFKYPIEQIIDLNAICKINNSIVVLSFIALILGFGALGKGNFSGILNHSNTLGPIAGLVCMERFITYIRGKKSLKVAIIGIMAFVIVILTGARSSLFTLFLAFSVVGLYIYRVKFIIFGTVILMVFIGLFFLFKNYNHLIIPEHQLTNRYRPRTIFEKGFDNTRLEIWGERLQEFKASPLFGSGYSSVNNKIIPETSASYDLETGSTQTGSGYLGILSMTGILGLSTFLLLIYVSFKKLYANKYLYKERTLLKILAIFLYILIHSIFEGYLISSGNILFFIFWITIGYIFNKNVKKT